MPKPVPPPPPQPSVEETVEAVRFVRRVMLVGALLFGCVAATYTNDSFFMRYGRSRTATWILHELDQLDEAEARAHDGGRVLWLVGSSITRDSFDVPWINQRLADRGSPFRVRKFAFNRGAAGVSEAVAAQLPLRPGDLLATTISIGNFRRDWVRFSRLKGDRLMLTVPPDEMWRIPSWSGADKLEQASAVPHDFWAFHDEIMAGVTAWLFEPLWWFRAPRPVRGGWKTRHRDMPEKKAHLARIRPKAAGSAAFMGTDSLDFSAEQFNIRGIARYEALAAERGVELLLLDVPPRQEYMLLFTNADARRTWDRWRSGRSDVYYFPQLPEDHFYDWKHPRGPGRAVLSQYLVRWLEDRPHGDPRPLDWTPPPDSPLMTDSPGSGDTGLPADLSEPE